MFRSRHGDPSEPAAAFSHRNAPGPWRDGRDSEPIAIVGIGCRFPGGATDPERFWTLLEEGVDAITETPADRWNSDKFYSPGEVRPGKTQSKWGGYVDDIDRFDPGVFGISPREAARIDPQQRMLLEVTWRALEDAGRPIESVAGRPVAVFTGISSFDYAVAGLSDQDHGAIGPYSNTGGSSSIAANRISYCFDLRGPSIAVDTACSSSLVAVHLACESLRRGESEMALAGGVNALLMPDFYVAFSQLGVLSPDGRCKAFDSRANGYVRGEGAGMVLLKPLRDAVRDGDPVYCVIRSTAVNQDGRSQGLTVPCRHAQEQLVIRACGDAGIDPRDVQYVETHGTGTSVGDPIEAAALASVFCANRDANAPCVIGSVKTNVGHLEAGAGIASLIKVALALDHGRIPKHLHFRLPNPAIDPEAMKLRIPTATEPWPGIPGRRIAGVNGFGYGGANAHVLVSDPPPSTKRSADRNTTASRGGGEVPVILPLSARSPAALDATIRNVARWLERLPPDASHREIASAAAHHRDHFSHRVAVVGTSVEEWRNRLGELEASSHVGDAASPDDTSCEQPERPVMFVFGGQGPQWWGMGRRMYESHAAYRQTIDRCDREFRKHADWSLIEELGRAEADSRMDQTSIAQPSLFAVQVALANVWAAVGVRPGLIVGHSVGEIAAAHVAGALSFEDACRVAIHRGRTMDFASSKGAMIAVGLSAAEATEVSRGEPSVSVAAINGPTSVTLSGPRESIDTLARRLEADGIFCRRLAVEYAFHSALMEPAREPLLRALGSIRAAAPEVPMISTVTGRAVEAGELNPDYWWQNVRRCVLFADAMRSAAQRTPIGVIEIGPHPALSYAMDECFREAGRAAAIIPSLRRDADDDRVFAESIAEYYRSGGTIRWSQLVPRPTRRVRLPPYPFQGQSLWYESFESRKARLEDNLHPLLGEPSDQAHPRWQSRVDLGVQRYLRDHCVRETCMFPAAGMIEVAIAAARQLRESSAVALERVRFHRPCLLDDDSAVRLETSFHPDRRRLELSMRSVNEPDWSSLASATVGDVGMAAPLEDAAVERVIARRDRSFVSDECYDYCRRLGLDYGDSFRGLVRGWRRDHEAVAEVRLPDSCATPATEHRGGDYGIHPALLDSCFHAMIVADENFDHTVDGLYLPTGIERVAWLRSPGEQAVVHVRVRRKTTQVLEADLDILDLDGTLCLAIRGFLSERVDGDAVGESVSDLVYGYQWIKSQRGEGAGGAENRGAEQAADEAADVPAEDAGVGGRADRLVCVFADEAGVGRRVAEAARRRGGRVVAVHRGDRLGRCSGDEMTIRADRRDDFVRCLDELRSRAAGQGLELIYCWGLDAPAAERLTLSGLERSGVLTALAPTCLVQACDEVLSGTDVRVTWVTAGAHSRDGKVDPVSVAQAPLVGLGRVVVNEQPRLAARLVDLPATCLEPAADDAGATACEGIADRTADDIWVDELIDPGDTEDEVMIRGGERWVRRFRPYFDRPLADDASDVGTCRLEVGRASGIEDLRYRSCDRGTLGRREVEIEVAATGLNFSDVMKCLRLYPGLDEGPVRLGAECSGRVTRVGASVSRWSVGDEVVAVTQAAFATHVHVDASLVAGKPAGLSFDEAATLPIAFLTADYALRECGRIGEGDSVLIHSASGGVGLAAIQLAAAAGARIYATAGSDAKREYLRSLGVEKVMDSRSLRFADEILDATDGAGVDLVLNSLPGEAIEKGLSILKPGGRFLEIGKRDLFADASLGLLPFRNNLAFFAIDLDQLLSQQPERMGGMFRELMKRFGRGELSPLPCTTWDASETVSAFRFMQQAKQIGKVAVRYDQPPTPVYPGSYAALSFRGDASYWVVGGLGGFGLEIAKWLARRGAGAVVLSGRSGRVPPEAVEAIRQIESCGCRVTVLPVDAADPSAVETAIARIDAELPPLRGLFHAAMVLEDRLLTDLDRDTLERVMRPKVLGGWNLHRATCDRELDHFVLFSSLSSVFGHAGQANYSAANAWLDALAHWRRAAGLPATAINWGYLGEAGYLARHAELGERLQRQGVLSFTVDQATDALEYALQTGTIQVSVLRMDWSRWRGLGLTGNVSPRFAELVRQGGERSGERVSPSRLRGVDPSDRRATIGRWLRGKVAGLLGFTETQLDPRRSLLDLGLDSLMAVETRNWIESQFEIEMPISALMRGTSLNRLTDVVCEAVESTAEGEAAVAETPADKFDPAPEPRRAQDLLTALPELSEQAVTNLLTELLRDEETGSS